jgi:hypothetical protein
MLFGCGKDRATLDSILPLDEFEGTIVSNNAAVYSNGYSKHLITSHNDGPAKSLRRVARTQWTWRLRIGHGGRLGHATVSRSPADGD